MTAFYTHSLMRRGVGVPPPCRDTVIKVPENAVTVVTAVTVDLATCAGLRYFWSGRHAVTSQVFLAAQSVTHSKLQRKMLPISDISRRPGREETQQIPPYRSARL